MSTPFTSLSDFPDRLSPMLVKELRQGMRAKMFLLIFLGLQIFLAFMLLFAGNQADSGSTISSVILVFFSIAVFLQPLRGANALSSEIKENTIDMLALTRLSAWRIVIGKWVAIIAQSALLLSSIIPYLILRYFLGGMNLVGEIVCIISIFLISVALTALTVGLSGCNSVVIRNICSLGAVLALLFLPMSFRSLFSSIGFDIFSLATAEARWTFLGILIVLIYLSFSILSLGASFIAPAAKNYALLRRLITIFLLGVLFVLSGYNLIRKELSLVLFIVISAPAAVIAFTEFSPLIKTVYAPFQKKGIIGKTVGAFLYPCHSSGVLFAVLLWILTLIGILFSFVDFSDIKEIAQHILTGSTGGIRKEEVVATLSLAGAFLFPAVWQSFFFRGNGQRIAHYLMLLIGSAVIWGIMSSLMSSLHSKIFLWFFAWHPFSYISMLHRSSSMDEIVALVGIVFLDSLFILILTAKAFLELRKSTRHISENTEKESV